MKKQTIQFIFGFFLIFSAFPVFAEFNIGVGDASTCSASGWMYFDRNGCVTGTACNIYHGSSGLPDPKDWICKSSSFTGYDPQYATCTNTASGRVCTCNSPTYENRSLGLITTTTTCSVSYAQPSTDILNYAIGLGLFGGGVAAGLASCTFGITPTCAASALAVLAGGGLIGAAAYPDGSSVPAPSPDPCANKTCVTFQIDPNKPISGAETFISRDSHGNMKPEGAGWNNNGDGTYTAQVTDGTVTVDTNSDRVTSNVTNSSGTFTATLQSGNYAGGLEFAVQGENLETSYTQQFTGSFDEQGVQQSQSQASSGTPPAGWNFNGATTGSGSGSGTGDTGDGTGSGTGSSAVDCATYGCAKEVTLKQISDELKNTRYDEAQQVKSDLNDLADNGVNAAADRMGEMLQSAIDDLGLDSLFDDVTDNLPIQEIIENNAANCSYSFALLGRPYELSICQHQDTIHSVLAFLFFIALSFGIVSLIFERPQGES